MIGLISSLGFAGRFVTLQFFSFSFLVNTHCSSLLIIIRTYCEGIQIPIPWRGPPGAIPTTILAIRTRSTGITCSHYFDPTKIGFMVASLRNFMLLTDLSGLIVHRGAGRWAERACPSRLCNEKMTTLNCCCNILVQKERNLNWIRSTWSVQASENVSEDLHEF